MPPLNVLYKNLYGLKNMSRMVILTTIISNDFISKFKIAFHKTKSKILATKMLLNLLIMLYN